MAKPPLKKYYALFMNNIKKKLTAIVTNSRSVFKTLWPWAKRMTGRFFKQSKRISKKKLKSGFFIALADRFIGSRFSIKEQALFMKRFAFLISAGVPVVEGLHILREQSKSKRHTRVFDKIIHDASNGQTLSKSFGKFPALFNNFSLHIIKVGESSGTLSQNLNYLAAELKKKFALKRKIISAFIYPAIVTVATLAITAFLMVYLFPKIMPVFASLHMTLPITTRAVMAASSFLQHWGLRFLLGLLIATILFVVIVKKNKQLRFIFTRFCLKLPIIGTVLQYYNVSNGSRTLGLLLKSGIRLSEALPIAADTTNNLVYKKAFNDLGEAVDRGEEISLRLHQQKNLFPDIFAHMIAVGEKSGNLPDTLVYLSELYESEVDEFTKNLSTLLEPALMIFMGVVIGFIAISIITPIYGITQNLHG